MKNKEDKKPKVSHPEPSQKASKSSKKKEKKPKDSESKMEVDSSEEEKPKPVVADTPKAKEKKEKKPAEAAAQKHKNDDVVMEKEKPEVPKDDEKDKESSNNQSKSKLGKRTQRPPSKPRSDTKRKKTETGEKAISAEKRKFKHMEWQYGKHCSRDLWIGKKVKVKIPAKNKDNESEYRFGKLVSIKENEAKEKVLFQIEWAHDKKKTKEWVNIKDTRVYIFGQILFLKHLNDSDQIDYISKTYGWKGKERKAVPIPVIELLDANDKEKVITPHQDLAEKIPVQYFMMEKAKKIKQDVLYEYREFKDDDFKFLRDNLKNGDKLYAKIVNYKKHYSQWIDKYGKIEVDMTKSLKEYCTKVVRVYKGDRNCGKAVVLR